MTTDSPPRTEDYSRWLHHWAVFTVCAAFVQVTLGAIVTTFRVGMADPVWPTAPWYLFTTSWQEPRPGFLIEHLHRLTGSLVGCTVIVLALGHWLREPRAWLRGLGVAALAAMTGTLALGFRFKEPRFWMLCLGVCLAVVVVFLLVAVGLREAGFWRRWLAALALAGVILLGLLGGFRVYFNELVGTDLAVVHGVLAQLFLALLVVLALSTSRDWVLPPSTVEAPEAAGRLQWLSALLVTGVLCQLVLGALLRHTHGGLWQRGHLLVAFVVVALAVWLGKLVLDSANGSRRLAGSVKLLLALVALQVVLGVEAWLVKFAAGTLPELVPVTVRSALVRTAHVLVGAGVLATSVSVALRAALPVLAPTAAPLGRLEGAA